ncbi:unnamed protein product [Aphanomyces euteiches]|uniref:Protein kinase domain-containing protein n=1 Tax=Aphanomyces euteiches TaxID=100861 RepID=A0A6G0WSX2_9STRA|nr:hypothetical protein Ae201684_011976 [Aphanomyces euteiches]KAH9056103.1 hypothetical protein Ae201684P_021841 [Aphanomyces euteiches]KAH9144421.1 hypothetical protein AeRB84_011646 [Aphanomyces euteiches]
MPLSNMNRIKQFTAKYLLMQRYTIERVLADALYGNVLHCVDKNSTRDVAIKRMDQSSTAPLALVDRVAADDVVFEKLVHEQLKAQGGHDHLLTADESFVEDGWDHLVFELCPNGELYDAVVNSPTGYLDLDSARRYMRQIASGVTFMHKLGFAHRDLSLENVLLDADDNCRICDFGLAAHVDTRRTEIVGKPFYMAPEVWAGLSYDATLADVWSLGIMLFMMLSGAPMFDTASETDNRFAFLKTNGLDELVQAWEIAECFDAQSLSLLGQMLEIDPAKRIPLAKVLEHPFLQDVKLDEMEPTTVDDDVVVQTKGKSHSCRQPSLVVL